MGDRSFVYKYQTKLLYETFAILIRNVRYFYTKHPLYETSGILFQLHIPLNNDAIV